MNKTLLESQEGVLYFTSLALSMISAISSVASHSVQNPQTLQRFLSPLYNPTRCPISCKYVRRGGPWWDQRWEGVDTDCVWCNCWCNGSPAQGEASCPSWWWRKRRMHTEILRDKCTLSPIVPWGTLLMRHLQFVIMGILCNRLHLGSPSWTWSCGPTVMMGESGMTPPRWTPLRICDIEVVIPLPWYVVLLVQLDLWR